MQPLNLHSILKIHLDKPKVIIEGFFQHLPFSNKILEK